MKWVLLIIGLICFIACKNNVKETPGGLKYKLIKHGLGMPAKKNEVVLYHARLIDANDSVWIDTYTHEYGFPMYNLIGDSNVVKEPLSKQLFRRLVPGDSVVMDLTVAEYSKAFLRFPPTKVDQSLRLSFRLMVDRIIAVEAVKPWMRSLVVRYNKKRMKIDDHIIDQYVKEKKIDAKKTNSGLRYIITRSNASKKAQSKQTVWINYKGYLLDGTCFDTNIKEVAESEKLHQYTPNVPYKVIIDSSYVVQGWHEALKLMSKGEKGTFYIPSPLGFGAEGDHNLVKGNSILVYDIEIVDIK